MIIVVQHVALGTRFSKETDAGAPRLVDTDTNESVVYELPLIISGLGLGARILCHGVERKESDPKQANDDA